MGQRRHTSHRLVLTGVLLVAFLHVPCGAAAGEDPEKQEPSIFETLGNDGIIFLEDGMSYFGSPLRFSGRDWLIAAGVAGGSVLLMSVDEETNNLVGRGTEKSLNGDAWDVPTRYGVVAYANIFSLGLYTGGLLAGSDDVRVTGRLLFESISYSGITVMALRYLFGRDRPYGDNTPWQFNWFETTNRVQAFPSGHTTVAFAMSTVLAEQVGGFWAGLFFYGIASMTGVARMVNNQHWLSDVVAGAGLGIVTGLHVVRKEREREHGSVGHSLEIIPGAGGISIVYRF